MEKISGIILGVYLGLVSQACYAADKFDILPDLPEPLASAAQASSVATVDTANTITNTQPVGQEPNLISLLMSLAFVILLIYATGILYTKLNKFGLKTIKRQIGENASSHATVLSTTPLGANKSLHVVELDGKRMLIGASANSIHLIKDLGSYTEDKIEEGEYSKIEIPNIRIPRIEIPKIEIPGFTKVISKPNKNTEPLSSEEPEMSADNNNNDDNFEISEIYEEENPDGIIDKLFHTTTNPNENKQAEQTNEHKVDPDEFALYKKYL